MDDAGSNGNLFAKFIFYDRVVDFNFVDTLNALELVPVSEYDLFFKVVAEGLDK